MILWTAVLRERIFQSLMLCPFFAGSSRRCSAHVSAFHNRTLHLLCCRETPKSYSAFNCKPVCRTTGRQRRRHIPSGTRDQNRRRSCSQPSCQAPGLEHSRLRSSRRNCLHFRRRRSYHADHRSTSPSRSRLAVRIARPHEISLLCGQCPLCDQQSNLRIPSESLKTRCRRTSWHCKLAKETLSAVA